MGILSGFIYICIQLSPIIGWILNGKLKSDENIFVFYLAIVGMLNNFYSGIPYGYYKYVFIIPCVYVLLSERNQVKNNELYYRNNARVGY